MARKQKLRKGETAASRAAGIAEATSGSDTAAKRRANEERKEKDKKKKTKKQPVKRAPIVLEPKKSVGKKILDVATLPLKAFAGSTAEVIPTKATDEGTKFAPDKAAELAARVIGGVGAGLGGSATVGVITKASKAAQVGKPAVTTLVKGKTGGIVGTASRFATNAKTIAGTTSLLTKVGMGISAAGLVAVTAGTYPFARFELAEATDKIGIAIFKAADAGDAEEVARLTAILEEMVDPSIWDSIVSFIPFANVLNKVNKNIKAAGISAESIKNSTEKKLEDARVKAEEPSFAEERRIADEESFARKRAFAEEESERFAKIEEERAATKRKETEAETARFAEIETQREERRAAERLEESEFFEKQAQTRRQEELVQRAEDTAFWEGEAKKKRALELVQMAEDTAFFEEIADKARAKKLKERAEDEAYWAKIKGEALDNQELEMLRAWNAGKSSLNFKWLGV